jgi:hypothetical protein
VDIGGVSLDVARHRSAEALIMQLGKTLVGAIIGAALGVGLLVIVYLQFGKDNMWMAIPVAILTGLGVRLMIARTGQASYARGALTVLIALGAYLGGLQVTSAFANRKAADLAKGVVHTETDTKDAEPGDTKGPEDAAAQPPAPPEQKAGPNTPMPAMGEPRRPQLPKTFSTWDFLALAVAALVAYELGRGSGGVYTGTPTAAMPSEPMAAGTHPDA